MTAITVELDAYIIPEDHEVFKFSPGKTYRFYQIVREAKAAFLDIRGLDQLPDDPNEWDDKAVLKAIADDRWTRELASRKRGNNPSGSEGVSRLDRRNFNFLQALIWEAKKGDLLVVPADGYRKDVLIGEVISEPGQVTKVTAKDGEDTFTYVGRKVKWIGAIEKRFFSSDMLSKLHNPNAIFLIGSSLREEIYKYAYGNFVFDNQFFAKFSTRKQKFTAEDSAVVSVWFNGLDYIWNAPDGKSAMSFYEMGLSELPDKQAAELQININSPGTYLLKSKDAFALALMAMLALSGCDAKSIADEGVTVTLKKVGGAGEECEHQIEKSVNQMAKALGPKNLEEACKLGERAMKDATLTTQATLKNALQKSR